MGQSVFLYMLGVARTIFGPRIYDFWPYLGHVGALHRDMGAPLRSQSEAPTGHVLHVWASKDSFFCALSIDTPQHCFGACLDPLLRLYSAQEGPVVDIGTSQVSLGSFCV